jgi:ADP-heptose:LPS heptosyltransferase
MTHGQRILADRLVAVPAEFLFNGIARLLGKWMRRDHSITSSKVNRIIVAKLIGMGSILQATPLLNALKRQYPHAVVTFVTIQSNQELVDRSSCVDEVLVLDDRTPFKMAVTTLQTIAALIRRRADMYFDLEVYSASTRWVRSPIVSRSPMSCLFSKGRMSTRRHKKARESNILVEI